MRSEIKYLLSNISAHTDDTHGLALTLIDYEHRDYIEDVLIEIFDIEYEFCIEKENGNFTLFFGHNTSQDKLNQALDEINKYHQTQGRFYDLPSET